MADAGKPITHLIRLRQAGQTREISIGKDEFLVGRDPTADVSVDVFEVSRRHCQIRVSSGRVFVRDLGSSNGTFVTGRKLRPDEEALVPAGQELSLGGKLDLLIMPAGKAAPPPSRRDPSQADEEMKQALKKIEEVQAEAVLFCETLKEEARREAEAIRTSSKSEFGPLLAELEKLKTQYNELKPVVDDLHQRHDHYLNGVAELETRRKTAEEMIQTLEARRETMETDSIQAQREKDRLTQEALEAGQDLAAIRDELDRNLKTLDKVKEESAEEAKKRKIQSETIEAEFHLKKVSFETRIAGIELQQIEAQRTLQAAQNERSELETRNTQAREQLEQIKTDLEKQRTLLAEQESRLEILRNEAKAAQDEADQTRKLHEKLLKDCDAAARTRLVVEKEIAETRKSLLEKVEIESRDLAAKLEKEATDRKAELEKDYAERKAALEKEHADRKGALDHDLISKGQEVERQVADAKLKEMEKIARLEKEAREQEKQRAVFMADDIARMVLEISGGHSLVGHEPELKAGILAALNGKTRSSIEAGRKTRAFWKKTAASTSAVAAVAAVLILFPGIFRPIRERISRTIASDKADNGVFLNEIQRLGSTYQPPTDHNYRDTYTDNILYLEGYVQMKLDEKQQKDWTLMLNDFIVGRLGLSDRVIPDFVSGEMVMLKDLLRLRQDILPQFKDQGIARMHKAEQQDIAPLLKLLQTPENYAKFREYEKSYYENYLQHRIPSAATSAQH